MPRDQLSELMEGCPWDIFPQVPSPESSADILKWMPPLWQVGVQPGPCRPQAPRSPTLEDPLAGREATLQNSIQPGWGQGARPAL